MARLNLCKSKAIYEFEETICKMPSCFFFYFLVGVPRCVSPSKRLNV